MRISTRTDLHDGSSCELDFNETEGWLRATWTGYIDPIEAYHGATNYLDAMQALRCPYLLNDNSALSGPWFDSVEWLRTVWGPQAKRLGLRYIAHVSQPQDLLDQASSLNHNPFGPELTLQVFDDVAHAEEWLREMRTHSA